MATEETKQIAVRLPLSMHKRINKFHKKLNADIPGVTKALAVRLLLDKGLKEEDL